MQTALRPSLLQTTEGKQADEILRNCVHCGFCNATCPTYQLTGDELDGPRGRIYLIKQALEGIPPTARTRLHLDRCLTCRACETTCPSGVDYHRLLDTGRALTEQAVARPVQERALRWLLRRTLAFRTRFALLLHAGQLLRPLLPATVQARIPARQRRKPFRPGTVHARSVLMLNGCVQPALAPQINLAAEKLLDALGIRVVPETADGCCGALSHHLGAGSEAKAFMRRNIDVWWPHIERGVEAIVVTASGCAPMVKDYGRLLADDPAYAERAARVSTLARDLSEVVVAEQPWLALPQAPATRVAFHSPCTLQHAQRLSGVVENLLQQCGFRLATVADAHLCCGSAGTYSILQGKLASTLRDNKLAALQADAPQCIATANIGCLAHMAAHATVPVQHWVQLLCALLPGETA
jgi:glycolate dehydrogenase iron-sulfur subunit